MVLSLLLGNSAFAQIYTGPILIKASGVDIGLLTVTDGSPETGYSANTAYWEWDDQPFPASNFYLKSDVTLASNTSENYPSSDFPGSATASLPSSIGQNDTFYLIRTCNATFTSCTVDGALWVENHGDELHWYMSAEYDGDVFAWDGSERLQFLYQSTLPSGSGLRLLEVTPN